MPSADLLRALRVDVMTAEVFAAFEASAVTAILLKGVVIARELYDHEGDRTYADLDCLVSPPARADAERVLSALGFRPESIVPAHLAPPVSLRGMRAQHWQRPQDEGEVDLHGSLFGLRASEHEVWSELSARIRRITVAGQVVRAPDRASLALVLALHALQHRDNLQHPRRDLERAIERWDIGVWCAARELARRLHALDEFAAGLSGGAAGLDLCRRLGLNSSARDHACTARAAHRRELAQWRSAKLHSVAEASTPRAWAAVARKLVLPRPQELRDADPRARNGRRAALMAAYVSRQLRLVQGATELIWLRTGARMSRARSASNSLRRGRAGS